MDFTKLLIGGGLAYGIYWYLSQPTTGAASTPTQGMVAAPLAPVVLTSATPASNNAMMGVLSTISAGSLDQAAKAAGYTTPSPYVTTWEGWNYFLSKLTGINGPPPGTDAGDFAVSNTLQMPASVYYPLIMGWAAQQAGLSALHGLSGLGVYVRENQHNG